MVVTVAIAAAAAACGPSRAGRAREDGAAAASQSAQRATPPPEVVAADVDRLLGTVWRAAQLSPAPRVDDAGFLRRAWLDLAGVVPPPEVVTRFLADKDLAKRRHAIEGLVTGARWGERWADRYDELLLGPVTKGDKGVDREGFHDWVRAAFARGMPYDRFVEALVTATGKNRGDDDAQRGVNGAVNWLVHFHERPEELAGTASRAFLGVQIQCAQCHDHKTEKWTQDDFRRFTACFLRMSAEPASDDKKRGDTVIRDVDRPAFLRAGKKKLMTNPGLLAARPAALDGTDLSRSGNPRRALAAWIVGAKNPWFAKAFVNRVWSMLLGRGFVNPVDDLRPGNAPLAPEVLERLAADFKASGYDVRRLVTIVASTEAYQLAPSAPRAGDGQLWSRFPDKPLDPDQLLDSIVAATGIEAILAQVSKGDPDGLRAELRRQMSFVFDVDEAGGAAKYEGTVAQALTLLNGRLVNTGVSAVEGGALAAELEKDVPDSAVIDAIYLRALGRHPDAGEAAHWGEFVATRSDVVRDQGDSAPPVKGTKRKQQPAATARDRVANASSTRVDRRLARADKLLPGRQTADEQAFEDILFALVNSSEFTFNH